MRRKQEKLILLTEKDFPSPVVFPARLQVGFSHSPGRKIDDRDRPVMEDKLLIHGRFRGSETEDLFGIFDGHDGSAEATYAAERFPELFSEVLGEVLEGTISMKEDELDVRSLGALSPSQLPIAIALHKTFQVLSSQMRESAVGTGGTTALLLYISGNDLFVANVGDTRAVLAQNISVGRNIVPLRLSVDHHLHVKEERDRIVSSGGVVLGQSVPRVDGILAISRALGDFDLQDKGVIWKPAINVIENFQSKGSFVVLGSDGLWELSLAQVSEDEVLQIVHEEISWDPDGYAPLGESTDFDFEMDDVDEVVEKARPKLQLSPTFDPKSPIMSAANSLLETAFSKHSTDNIGIIVVRWS